MSKLVTIFGGSGFVGRYIARRMAKQGWRVRVAVRRPNEAMFVKPYGAVGQVEPVLCNIRDDASVAAAMAGADAVVNCVGILVESGKNTFDGVQADGAGRVARIAAQNGVQQMVQISAIGADPDSDSDYARTKAAGEVAVLKHMPDAVILRSSVIFGDEDGFFNKFGNLTRFGPILPMTGGSTLFQPVYVDDVAQAAELAVLGKAEPGVYELGGPDVISLRGCVDLMLKTINRRRLVIDLPFWIAGIKAGVLDIVQYVSFGLITNGILTRDQVRNLKNDNVVAEGAKGFADLGIKPVDAASVVPEYLWKFRPAGQYNELTQSARKAQS